MHWYSFIHLLCVLAIDPGTSTYMHRIQSISTGWIATAGFFLLSPGLQPEHGSPLCRRSHPPLLNPNPLPTPRPPLNTLAPLPSFPFTFPQNHLLAAEKSFNGAQPSGGLARRFWRPQGEPPLVSGSSTFLSSQRVFLTLSLVWSFSNSTRASTAGAHRHWKLFQPHMCLATGCFRPCWPSSQACLTLLKPVAPSLLSEDHRKSAADHHRAAHARDCSPKI
jgi:hypothetical protein